MQNGKIKGVALTSGVLKVTSLFCWREVWFILESLDLWLIMGQGEWWMPFLWKLICPFCAWPFFCKSFIQLTDRYTPHYCSANTDGETNFYVEFKRDSTGKVISTTAPGFLYDFILQKQASGWCDYFHMSGHSSIHSCGYHCILTSTLQNFWPRAIQCQAVHSWSLSSFKAQYVDVRLLTCTTLLQNHQYCECSKMITEVAFCLPPCSLKQFTFIWMIPVFWGGILFKAQSPILHIPLWSVSASYTCSFKILSFKGSIPVMMVMMTYPGHLADTFSALLLLRAASLKGWKYWSV